MTPVVGGCSINELGNGDICGFGATHQSVSSILDPAPTDTLDCGIRDCQRNWCERSGRRTGVNTDEASQTGSDAMVTWVANSRSAAIPAAVGSPWAATSASADLRTSGTSVSTQATLSETDAPSCYGQRVGRQQGAS